MKTNSTHLPPTAKRRAGASVSICLLLLLTLMEVIAAGQSYSILHSFGGRTNADGAIPAGGLTMSSGTLYGATGAGGTGDYGTIFKINTDGSGYTVLFHCAFPDVEPQGSLALSGATPFFATLGGFEPGPGYPGIEWTLSQGTVFNLNTNGDFVSRLVYSGYYRIQGMDMPYDGPPGGLHPSAGLVWSDTGLYGTGQSGWGYGTVYRASTGGAEILKELDGYSRGEVVVAGNTLFGTTMDGSSNHLGTVFALDAITGDYTVLKQFTGLDGASPDGSLLLDGATLYGVTESGGAFGRGTVFSIATNGSNFTVLKHFTGSDGSYPHSGLCLSGARLFGATGVGGNFDHGTVFQLYTNGASFAVLKHFTGADGDEPYGAMQLDGTALYGTTGDGGAFDEGVVFRLSLAPVLAQAACDGASFRFAFETFSNLNYTVEYNDDPGTTNWLLLETMTGNGSVMPCVIPLTNSPQRFFRVRQP